ncbi:MULTISPECIES: helicase associated domain-containing protein [unclassified Streptomyces]|nr:Helicase associated domain protein [Streptomyces sp. NBC_00228]
MGTFERGVAALAQYGARTGSVTVPRGHVEQLEDGTEVRFGVWIINEKSRRAKLTVDKLAALTALGLDWAAVEEAERPWPGNGQREQRSWDSPVHVREEVQARCSTAWWTSSRIS